MTTSPLGSVVRHAPRFAAERVAAFVLRRYRLHGTFEPLPSERDQNVLITTPAGARYVLKIANPTEVRETLAFQHAALAHLARDARVVVPRWIETTDGEWLPSLTDDEGRTFHVRMLTFIPGRCLGDVRPHTPELLGELGASLARMDLAFRGFEHPGMTRSLPWDMRVLPAAAPFVADVGDPARRRQLERGLRTFADETLPRLLALRAQVIHNDWNDYNVIVTSAEPGRWHVVTAIDYGDALHAPLVCDLAVALAYALMHVDHLVDGAARVVGGFHQELPLMAEELALLPDLVRARLLQSLLMAAHQHRLAPGNDYLLISQRDAWRLLDAWEALPGRYVSARLRAACGFEAVPGRHALAAWIEDDARPTGSIFGSPPDAPALVVRALHLDVDAADLDAPVGAGGAASTQPCRAALDLATPCVAVTRWSEARWMAGAVPALHEGIEPETISTGSDLCTRGSLALHTPFESHVRLVHRTGAGAVVVLEPRAVDGPTFVLQYRGSALRVADEVVAGTTLRASTRVGVAEPSADGIAHVHVMVAADSLGFEGGLPSSVRIAERTFWEQVTFDPTVVFGWGTAVARRPASTEALLARRRAHVSPSLSVSYRTPLTIVRGRGTYLFDADGRAYLDCVNNVAHVGHAHPHVSAALARQAAVLNTNTRYLHEHLAAYAEALTATLPAPLSVCFFVCSGSEANDLALRLARAYTRARGVVVIDGAYHGNLTSLIEISPYKFDGPGGTGRPAHVRVLPMPDAYRGRHRAPEPALGPRYAAYAADALASLAEQGDGCAAFVGESVLSCGGQVVLPPGYLSEVYRQVRHAGGVVVADEVQVGFGRVGSHMWGFETQDVVPDIVTMGKPIGNGHPMGAVVTTPAIARAFANGMEYFNTFGGNPVSCAVGRAVLEVLASEGLQGHAGEIGAVLSRRLAELGERHQAVGDVRGLGLFAGVELVSDREARTPDAALAAAVVNRLRERGVLVSTDGPDHNVLKIKPPMVFSRQDVETLASRLDEVLREMATSRA